MHEKTRIYNLAAISRRRKQTRVFAKSTRFVIVIEQ